MMRRLRRWAFPAFECEQCVGQEWWRGCDCAYRGGVAPGVGPGWWRARAQRFIVWWDGEDEG